ncbi:MAG: 3-deoxy-7-phosphoheptulonate synthase [Myxococcales bacterium]|nr:3-deoxy-7-phosphoheptulonate synthase [Myxococcales bacterium]
MSTKAGNWTPDTWRHFPMEQAAPYPDEAAVSVAVERLKKLPPLVTSFEIERLKDMIAEAQRGERFVLQGGDCAETLIDCDSTIISSKLKILLQMSLVLLHASKKPVVRIGRFAGQYAKPRSKPAEKGVLENGEETSLPSYFGDLVNRPAFTLEDRQADPMLLIEAYKHAALTLNFIRSLSDSGFADVHHPEYWDLRFMEGAKLSPGLRAEYENIVREVISALQFTRALGEKFIEEFTRVEFFASHEGLNLLYESAQTRTVPRREGWYDLTTHLPWIGERTRGLEGAHVEFFRGIRNPVGVKIGPSASGDDVMALIDALNPDNEPGKLVLITRFGATQVRAGLAPILNRVKREGRHVLWMSDPMHGNTQTTASGVKTRHFGHILDEIAECFSAHEEAGTHLGGVHFELTGEDVTECTGGADGLTEDDLHLNYATACDPRLNYRQALEMSFQIARRMVQGEGSQKES